jgi:hypothetical protein
MLFALVYEVSLITYAGCADGGSVAYYYNWLARAFLISQPVPPNVGPSDNAHDVKLVYLHCISGPSDSSPNTMYLPSLFTPSSHLPRSLPS